MTCTVAHIVEGALGKYGEQDAEETVIMELEWLIASINMPHQITKQLYAPQFIKFVKEVSQT